MAEAPSENSERRTFEERLGDLNITGTTQDSTSDESSSVSTEATSDCRETASTTNAQGGVQCHGNCDGNPIYPNDKHIKRREGKEAILGSRQQFCAAFYHVNKWSYPERKLCCLDKDCKVFKRVRFTGNEKLQPKAVVGVAKYKIEGNNGVLYEARYTNCSKHQKHAEDFFRDDVKSGMLAATIDENKGGTLTIYLTLQPCNWSTTIKPEGTKVTRSDHSCCKTLTDIVTELQKNEVKLCVKPTHLCNLEIRDADINDDKDHEPHPDDPNIDAEAKYKHLQENAARGIKMLMKLNEENNDVDVSAMTKVDWEYLRRITDIDIQQSMSDDECNQRKELDRHIDNVIKKYKKKTGAKYRHSKGEYQVRKAECLNCTLGREEVNGNLQQIQDEIDRELKVLGKVRQHVPGDGHCLIYSWFKALACDSTNHIRLQGRKHLLRMGCSEIEYNLEFYSSFINFNDIDPIEELRRYEENHDYNGDIVDLMVYALANVTETTAYILTYTGGRVVTLTVPPTRPGRNSKGLIYLCKIGCHYDPALNISKVESLERESVIITDSPVKKAAFTKRKVKLEPIVVFDSPNEKCTVAREDSISLNHPPVCLSNRFEILSPGKTCVSGQDILQSHDSLITHSDADSCEQFDICKNSCLSDGEDVIILSEDSASVPCSDSEHESLDMESVRMNSDDDPLLECKASKRKRKIPKKIPKKSFHGVSKSSCSQSSSDVSENDGVSKTATRLTLSHWKDVEMLKTSSLPVGIDGKCAYEIPFNPDEKMASSKNDGRNWMRYMPSRRSGFSGVRRLARCKGSYRCRNDNCNFLQEYGRPNNTQFSKNGKCNVCGLDGAYVPCEGRKVWEFDDVTCKVRVYHTGDHSCPVLCTESAGKKACVIEEFFRKNPSEKPRKAVNTIITDAIKEGKSWNEVERLTDSLLDVSKVKNKKQKVSKSLNPSGHSFEAVGKFKAEMSSKDPLYVFKANDETLNPDLPTFVFCTSTLKAQMGLKMDREGDHFLSEEFCHFDGKHGRAKGYKTLALSVYHKVLRKQIVLAVMHVLEESADTIELFWKTWNEVLKKISNDLKTIFRPKGYMMDEHGGNWEGLKRVAGEDELKLCVSCEFHFKDSVNKHANKLTSTYSKSKFKRAANELLTAVSPSSYECAYGKLAAFINEKPSKRSFLQTWLDWWDRRREHFCHAYRLKTNMPATNLSEVVNSSWSTAGLCGLNLIDAIRDDVTDSVKLERQWKSFGCGAKCGGTGPDSNVLESRERAKQIRRAALYSQELLAEDDVLLAHEEKEFGRSFRVDPLCTHRPDRRQRRKSNAPKCKKVKKNAGSAYNQSDVSDSELRNKDESTSGEGAPTKHNQNKANNSNSKTKARTCNEHQNLDSEDCSSSDDTIPTKAMDPNEKRNGSRFRKKRSIVFQKQLSNCQRQYQRMKVISVRKVNKDKFTFVIKSAQVTEANITYDVSIGKSPSCSCPIGLLTKRTVCKHILFVYLYVLGITESCTTIQEIELTKAELKPVINACEQYQSSISETAAAIFPLAGSENIENPFDVVFISSAIKVCSGCPLGNNKFRRHPKEVLKEPYDLIVRHKEIREWRQAGGNVKTSNGLKNAYYHLNASCIRVKNANFENSMLKISEKVKQELKSCHKLYLKQHFDISLG